MTQKREGLHILSLLALKTSFIMGEILKIIYKGEIKNERFKPQINSWKEKEDI